MAAELFFLAALAWWLVWLLVWWLRWLRVRHRGGPVLAVLWVAAGWLWLTGAATLVARLLDLFLDDPVGPSAGLKWTLERGLLGCGVVAAVLLASAAARRVRR
jgi:hypothetical protein